MTEFSIARMNPATQEWEHCSEGRWFRVSIGQQRFDLLSRDGALQIRTEGQAVIKPAATNVFNVTDTRT